MSHVTTLKTQVQFKDLGLLMKALQQVGELTNVCKDYYGNTQVCAVAVKTKEFERGIGFVLRNGVYVPMADKYQHAKQVQELLNRVQQKYQAEAIKRALRRQRYSSIKISEKDGVVQIHARRY